MKNDDRIVGRDYFTPREWADMPRVGASGSSMVRRSACVHDITFGSPCEACAKLEKAYQRNNRKGV